LQGRLKSNAMAEINIKGIKGIRIGPPAADGGMSTTLVAFCTTVGGSASLESADGEEIKLDVEESADPANSDKLKGETTIKWRIADFTPDTMVKVLGGTVTGTGAAKAWEAPRDSVSIEQSIAIDTAIPVTGKVEVVRGSISARVVAPLDKKQWAGIEITVKVLLPNKAAIGPWKWTPGA
jgi:hypothetical protein